MKQNDLIAIENILIRLIELKVITANHEEQFFLENLEMNILIEYIEEIASNINKISDALKTRYKDINWSIIQEQKYEDEIMGSSMKIGKVYPLAKSLYEALYDKLIGLLSENIDKYYHDLCEIRHEEIKSSNKEG